MNRTSAVRAVGQLRAVKRLAQEVLYEPEYEPRLAPRPPFLPWLDEGRLDQLKGMVIAGLDLQIESVFEERKRTLTAWGYAHVEWAIDEAETFMSDAP